MSLITGMEARGRDWGKKELVGGRGMLALLDGVLEGRAIDCPPQMSSCGCVNPDLPIRVQLGLCQKSC